MRTEGYAVREGNTTREEAARFRQDILDRLRGKVREVIEVSLQEELAELLGSGRYERTEVRRGYRNGLQERTVTTVMGPRSLRIPRARVVDGDGTTREFRSALLPRYARRTREIDAAILGIYLAGANSRRIRKALEPLLGTENLSKSAVSRLVGRLKDLFAAWNTRDLASESYAFAFLDGFHLKVRMAGRVISVPVLAVLGVNANGLKVLVSLRLAPSEAAGAWSGVLLDLQKRGLAAPLLIIVDGHAGLHKALEAWPGVKVQRCTQHKLANLEEHCPAHARPEMRRDYRKIITAANGLAARQAAEAFAAKWSKLCPAVARSFSEAGSELLTFYEFPKALWRSLRTTNPLENLNREFRRRTKTQASFSQEAAALTLLYGLVAFGQIRMNRIDGHRDVRALVAQMNAQAA